MVNRRGVGSRSLSPGASITPARGTPAPPPQRRTVAAEHDGVPVGELLHAHRHLRVGPRPLDEPVAEELAHALAAATGLAVAHHQLLELPLAAHRHAACALYLLLRDRSHGEVRVLAQFAAGVYAARDGERATQGFGMKEYSSRASCRNGRNVANDGSPFSRVSRVGAPTNAISREGHDAKPAAQRAPFHPASRPLPGTPP